MKKNKAKIKFLNMFLLVCLIIPMFSSLANADAHGESGNFDYMQKILSKGAFEKAKRRFEQPDPMFKIETSDGQVIESKPATFLEADLLGAWEKAGKNTNPYYLPAGETLKKVNPEITVPVGTKLKLTDVSKPSVQPGVTTKIMARDWQNVKTDHGILQAGSNYKNFWEQQVEKDLNKKSVTWIADKKGWMYLFLSNADDYTPYKASDKATFENWNSFGNYRTTGTGYHKYLKREMASPERTSTKDWYFKMVKIFVADDNEMILREMELIDPETDKVIESFRRDLDPLDPLNIKKQKIVATHGKPDGASILKKNKEYKVRAKFQFIDFTKGSFDISKNSMTDVQKNLTTGVNTNTLDVKYAFGVNTGISGKFDKTQVVTSYDKPNVALKNLETASFEWTYTTPKDQQKLKIAGLVPNGYAKKNSSTLDDWGALFAMIEPTDLALHHPVEFLDSKGNAVDSVIPGENHSFRINAQHLMGKVPLGLNHTGTPEGNDRFTISVNAREGSASGNYLKKEEKEKIHSIKEFNEDDTSFFM